MKKIVKNVAVVLGVAVVLLFGSALVKDMLDLNVGGGIQGLSPYAEYDSVVSDGASYNESAKSTQRMQTVNYSLRLEVGNVNEAVDQMVTVAEEKAGYVTRKNISSTEDETRGSLVLEVPREDAEEVVEKMKELSADVEHESYEVSDVTKSFEATEAQIKNLERLEKEYQETLEMSEEVYEDLAVKGRLERLRIQIEQAKEEKSRLESSVEFTTISATLTSVPNVEIFGVSFRPGYEVRASARMLVGGLAFFAIFLIRFLFIIPLIVFWGALVGVIVYILVRATKVVYNRTKSE